MNFRFEKREKCNFGSTFRPRKKHFFLIFLAFSGRTQRNLTIPDEKNYLKYDIFEKQPKSLTENGPQKNHKNLIVFANFPLVACACLYDLPYEP